MRPKTQTRLSVLLLCLLLICLPAMGCGRKDSPAGESGSTPSPDGSATPLEQLPDKDMEGFEMTFLNYTDAAHGFSLKTIVPEESTTSLNKAIFTRNTYVETRYSAVILEEQTDTMLETLNKYTLAGTDEKYHVAMIFDQKVVSAIVAGSLRIWDGLSYCNLDSPWWNDSASGCFMLGEGQYGAVGDFSLSIYSKNYCYFFNKALFSTIPEQESPYDLVNSGEWTLDKMLEIAEAYTMDLDGDGLWYDGTDQYGLAGTTKVHYQMVLTGAGISFVERDASGNPYFAWKDNAYILERVTNIIGKFNDTVGYYNNNPSSPNGSIISTEFLDGHVLMLASTVWNMTDYQNYDVNIGVLPAPKYNSDQESYYSVSVGGVIGCIPRGIPEEDTENVGILLEAMSCYSRDRVVPEYREILLKTRYASDPEDSEMLQLIFDTTVFDPGVVTWSLDIRTPIMADIFNDLNSGVASYINTIAPRVEEAINSSIYGGEN